MRDAFEWYMAVIIGILAALLLTGFMTGCSVLERPGEYDHLPPVTKTNTVNLSHITPPPTFPRPSFKVLMITDRPHEVLRAEHAEVIKCYVLEIESDGGIWKLVMDQNNRTIFQRFALR